MAMRLFLDTNVMLDFLGERDPFYVSAAKIATLADKRSLQIIVSALSYATISYFLTKYDGLEKTKDKLRKFKVISEICELDEVIIEKGLNSEFSDFEDSLQYFSALRAECDIIITRNGKDFKKSEIPVMSPDEFLNSIKK
ncbi:MAG: PIN domain nuclease [Bacteroidetes bacterium CG18_big_fil_WC_8_21_14_2_50_41_14]|nr:MAG: PIN domain nuclease [Bacteroidetes bacterium CG18_big_fil_WC_8_21_14_2_50_41_14]PJB57489.1 MAG: PIN domain nuclease [Bacteroidetes bacterium CG_4_9_14_3_um_filter_41_19]